MVRKKRSYYVGGTRVTLVSHTICSSFVSFAHGIRKRFIDETDC
jgi:hypothetical protein